MTTTTTDLQQQLRAERSAVETLYRAFSEQDPDLVDTILAPDWDDIPLAPGQAPGPAGIKPIIRMLAAALPDVHITIHDLLQEPGKTAVRAEISGTHLGELFGIAPTGKGLHQAFVADNHEISLVAHKRPESDGPQCRYGQRFAHAQQRSDAGRWG